MCYFIFLNYILKVIKFSFCNICSIFHYIHFENYAILGKIWKGSGKFALSRSIVSNNVTCFSWPMQVFQTKAILQKFPDRKYTLLGKK